MFKNFQEHFERSEESRFGSDFLGFNPKFERIKLLLSAILIPVGCSFFYFLHTGYKYADLESAIGEIEIIPTLDSERETISAMSNSVLAESDSFLPSNTTIVFDDETEDSSVAVNSTPIMGFMSDFEPVTKTLSDDDSNNLLTENQKMSFESIQTTYVTGRNLTELTEFLITDSEQMTVAAQANLNAGRSQTELAMLITGNNRVDDKLVPKINEISSDDKIDQDIAIIAASQFTASVSILENQTRPDQIQHVDPRTDGVITHNSIDENVTRALDPDAVATVVDDNLEVEPIAQNSAVDTRHVTIVETTDRSESLRDSRQQSVDAVEVHDKLRPASTIADTQSIETFESELATATLKDEVKPAREISEEESRVILVDKIIGLLKSEVITTHSTADTGKRRITNRHTHPIKKSFDVNKLESILEDI